MHRICGLLTAFVVLAFLTTAKADVFLLRSGGRIEGQLVNADENPRTSYVIALPGGQITLEAAMVEKVQTLRPELAEYEKARRLAPDTIEGQLKLAEWCREQGLTAQRKTHLERVLQLDTNQAEARRLLGYRKVKDQWMTHDEEMADKGLVRRVVDGNERWLTQEEADNLDAKQRQRKGEALWRKNISTWRKWLDGVRAGAGKKNLQDIDDPVAIVPLAEHLKKDSSTDARLIYVEVLARFNSHDARGPLSKSAIDDSSDDVRISCLDALEKQKDDMVTKYFESRMRDKNASDETIDRAGVALGRIKDPTSVATLVEYVAYERTIVLPSSGGPGSMTTSFGRGGAAGGGGLSMNQKPKTVKKLVECRAVLDALVTITGQNFGYDPRAWQTWYKNQKAAGAPIAKK